MAATYFDSQIVVPTAVVGCLLHWDLQSRKSQHFDEAVELFVAAAAAVGNAELVAVETVGNVAAGHNILLGSET